VPPRHRFFHLKVIALSSNKPRGKFTLPLTLMKKLLLHALALITALLPLQMADAAPKPPAVYGGFEVGKTFTMRVNTRSAAANVNGQIVNPAAIPPKVADYAIGQEVTFTIGKKGELIAPGVKLGFTSDGGSSNVYTGKIKPGNTPTGLVFKNTTTGEPTGVSLYFIATKGGRSGVSVTQVTYTLNP